MIIKDIKDRCTTIKHLIEDGVRAKNLSMLNRGFSFFQQTYMQMKMIKNRMIL